MEIEKWCMLLVFIRLLFRIHFLCTVVDAPRNKRGDRFSDLLDPHTLCTMSVHRQAREIVSESRVPKQKLSFQRSCPSENLAMSHRHVVKRGRGCTLRSIVTARELRSKSKQANVAQGYDEPAFGTLLVGLTVLANCF
jgi:hypothetical protein